MLPPPRRSRLDRRPRVGDFVDPSVLNGASPVGLFARLVVPLALCGEIAAFYTVLSVLFGSWWWITLLGTVGFAGISYGLAHQTGISFKEWKRSEHPWAGSPWGPALGWLTLGAAAVLARLYSSPIATSIGAPPGGGITFPGAGSGGAPPAGGAAPAVNGHLIAALFFGALYLGSGVVAGYVAYRSHNPDLVALNTARSAHAAATEPHETSLTNLRRLQERDQELIATLEDADAFLATARRDREAIACALKARGRLMAASATGMSAGALDDAMHDTPRPDTTPL
jgi:hypothetical protein